MSEARLVRSECDACGETRNQAANTWLRKLERWRASVIDVCDACSDVCCDAIEAALLTRKGAFDAKLLAPAES